MNFSTVFVFDQKGQELLDRRILVEAHAMSGQVIRQHGNIDGMGRGGGAELMGVIGLAGSRRRW